MTNNTYIWIDLEMTGLGLNAPVPDQIIEMAIIVTDKTFNTLKLESFAHSYNLSDNPNSADFIVYEDSEAYGSALNNMSPKVEKMHTDNGLLLRIRQDQKVTHQELKDILDRMILELQDEFGITEFILCGNTISMDESFMIKYFPEFIGQFTGTIDVSTLKELFKLRYPTFPLYQKSETHLGIDDIRESLAELNYYLGHLSKGNYSETVELLTESERHNVPQELVWLKFNDTAQSLRIQFAITDNDLNISYFIDKTINPSYEGELSSLENEIMDKLRTLPEGSYPLCSDFALSARESLTRYFPRLLNFFFYRNITLETLFRLDNMFTGREFQMPEDIRDGLFKASNLLKDHFTDPSELEKPLGDIR